MPPRNIKKSLAGRKTNVVQTKILDAHSQFPQLTKETECGNVRVKVRVGCLWWKHREGAPHTDEGEVRSGKAS